MDRPFLEFRSHAQYPNYNGDMEFTICDFAIDGKLSDRSALGKTELYE
jgi:hypothetical protein